MRFTPDFLRQLTKAAALGGFTGIVFAVIFAALPGAALLFVVGVLDLNWDLSWFPGAMTLLLLGAIIGALSAAALFIKDQHIPYVEPLQDFEEDPDDDRYQ